MDQDKQIDQTNPTPISLDEKMDRIAKGLIFLAGRLGPATTDHLKSILGE